jgi:endoribonuclease LACTB2
MPKSAALTIVDVGYRSTHYWVVSAGRSRLLVDLGWPGTMGQMQASLQRMDVPLDEIRYGLATHYHIDHAGLAQELKLAGVPLLVLDVQVDAIPQMVQWTKPRDNYVDITLHDNVVITFDQSRGLLHEIGIEGQIVHTPAHSPDSVSLVLDGGAAFTGDLPPEGLATGEDLVRLKADYDLLRALGVTTLYPAHGPVRPLAAE